MAEPSADAVAFGAILTIVAQQPKWREANAFSHEVRLEGLICPSVCWGSCLN